MGVGCGFSSSQVLLRGEKLCCVGTMNGFLQLFDLRGNLITNTYAINEGNAPIRCLRRFTPASHYSNMVQKDMSINSSMMIAASFGSLNN